MLLKHKEGHCNYSYKSSYSSTRSPHYTHYTIHTLYYVSRP